jgi:class I fructose-bisphosphate aldolase
MQLGKSIRLERIINRNTQRAIVVPMDHGITVGPIKGLTDMRETVNACAEGGADAVLMHKGLPRISHRKSGRDLGLIIHLNAGTSLSPNPNTKTLTTTIEEAIRIGADAVSIHVNMGAEDEGEMLADLGRSAGIATGWGIPLLAMMYARGPLITDQYAPENVAHCARAAVELGADIVKVVYTGDIQSFTTVVQSCGGVPILIAGGPQMDSTKSFLTMVHDSIRAGGSGISVGRNVFQHKHPGELLTALRGLVHQDWDVEQAMDYLKSHNAQ